MDNFPLPNSADGVPSWIHSLILSDQQVETKILLGSCLGVRSSGLGVGNALCAKSDISTPL